MTTDLSWLYSPAMFQLPERLGTSAWLEHTPFAFWLIDKLRPQRFVELGTHNGISFCAAAQAVRQLSTGTACHAVDTWQGDAHAGYYGDAIYKELASYIEPRYGSFGHLIRSTFDDALSHFEDKSIDLLHIDGLHTYEAVAHDYETWLPKVKDGGVILFHDTNVRIRDFGVHRFCAEVSKDKPGFEFLHGYGLGVLANGHAANDTMEAFFATSLKPTERSSVSETFAYLGAAVTTQLRLAFANKRQASR